MSMAYVKIQKNNKYLIFHERVKYWFIKTVSTARVKPGMSKYIFSKYIK